MPCKQKGNKTNIHASQKVELIQRKTFQKVQYFIAKISICQKQLFPPPPPPAPHEKVGPSHAKAKKYRLW